MFLGVLHLASVGGHSSFHEPMTFYYSSDSTYFYVQPLNARSEPTELTSICTEATCRCMEIFEPPKWAWASLASGLFRLCEDVELIENIRKSALTSDTLGVHVCTTISTNHSYLESSTYSNTGIETWNVPVSRSSSPVSKPYRRFVGPVSLFTTVT